MLDQNGTRILKFYLHISPEEQLARFKQRLDDPARHWKISETDYSERELWPQYVAAFEDAMEQTSTKHAPWYVIPGEPQMVSRPRDLADRRRHHGGDGPQATAHRVDIADIRGKYHAAEQARAKIAAEASRAGRKR